jgi:hypothetical protein
MQCPKCGPTPDNTIWDGVTLAFGQKHLLPSLQTPAASHEDSLKRKCKYVGKQQIVPDSALRKVINKLIKGPFLVNEETKGNNVEEFIDHLRAIPDMRKQLLKHSTWLDSVFGEWFGIEAAASHKQPPKPYIRLFVQVCVGVFWRSFLLTDSLQLCAEESILQMANRPALEELARFVEEPSTKNASRLVCIPVLYDVLKYHEPKPYPTNLLNLCAWLHKRGHDVLGQLIIHKIDSNIEQLEAKTDEDWKKVLYNICYNVMPI